MGFLKMLIGLPLLAVIVVFSFVNNDLVNFSLWPFYIEITVSLSVAIVFFILVGFIIGWFFTWLSYSPVRSALRLQKKQNKKLNKEQQKLTKEMEDLHVNLASLKELEAQKSKPSFSAKFRGLFSRSSNAESK